MKKFVKKSGQLQKRNVFFSSSSNLENFWMPFSDTEAFKRNPKLLDRADGLYYYLENDKPIFDGMSGLWCVNAGHKQKKIVEAIQNQVEKLDFAPSFNTGNRLAFQFAEKIINEVLPPETNFKQVFFTMCGSTAVDTALKIALAYYRARGEGNKSRFVGRERGYHGVGFGG
jgi:beta-alanine--pyruvate transaminase